MAADLALNLWSEGLGFVKHRVDDLALYVNQWRMTLTMSDLEWGGSSVSEHGE